MQKEKCLIESSNGTNYASNQSSIPILVGSDTKIFKIARSSPKLCPFLCFQPCETISTHKMCHNFGFSGPIFKLFVSKCLLLKLPDSMLKGSGPKSLKISQKGPELQHVFSIEQVSQLMQQKRGSNFGLDGAILKIFVSNPTKMGMLD